MHAQIELLSCSSVGFRQLRNQLQSPLEVGHRRPVTGSLSHTCSCYREVMDGTLWIATLFEVHCHLGDDPACLVLVGLLEPLCDSQMHALPACGRLTPI